MADMVKMADKLKIGDMVKMADVLKMTDMVKLAAVRDQKWPMCSKMPIFA